jgi:hypothetical protein
VLCPNCGGNGLDDCDTCGTRAGYGCTERYVTTPWCAEDNTHMTEEQRDVPTHQGRAACSCCAGCGFLTRAQYAELLLVE